MNISTKNTLKQVHRLSQKQKSTWCISKEMGEFLHLLVLAHKPKHILEIGTSIGFSTLWLASAAQTYGGKITTVEVNEEKIVQAKRHFAKANLNNITIINAEAVEWIKSFKKKTQFVFLDAGKAHYLHYLKHLEKNNCLKKGALIAADNTALLPNKIHTEVKKYLAYVRKSKKFKSSHIPFHSGLEISLRLDD